MVVELRFCAVVIWVEINEFLTEIHHRQPGHAAGSGNAFQMDMSAVYFVRKCVIVPSHGMTVKNNPRLVNEGKTSNHTIPVNGIIVIIIIITISSS